MLSMVFVSLQSTDVDFSFSLLTRIANSPFSLNQNNGQLFITGILDYEERNSYTVSSCTHVSMHACVFVYTCMYVSLTMQVIRVSAWYIIERF